MSTPNSCQAKHPCRRKKTASASNQAPEPTHPRQQNTCSSTLHNDRIAQVPATLNTSTSKTEKREWTTPTLKINSNPTPHTNSPSTSINRPNTNTRSPWKNNSTKAATSTLRNNNFSTDPATPTPRHNTSPAPKANSIDPTPKISNPDPALKTRTSPPSPKTSSSTTKRREVEPTESPQHQKNNTHQQTQKKGITNKTKTSISRDNLNTNDAGRKQTQKGGSCHQWRPNRGYNMAFLSKISHDKKHRLNAASNNQHKKMLHPHSHNHSYLLPNPLLTSHSCSSFPRLDPLSSLNSYYDLLYRYIVSSNKYIVVALSNHTAKEPRVEFSSEGRERRTKTTENQRRGSSDSGDSRWSSPPNTIERQKLGRDNRCRSEDDSR